MDELRRFARQRDAFARAVRGERRTRLQRLKDWFLS